jgi:AcrR family transcriptional regulator
MVMMASMSTVPVRPLSAKSAAKSAAKPAAKPAVKLAVKRTRRAAPEASAARASLTPEAWVDAATEVLVDQGIDHVRVDVLATQLQVTRGSFYWHFRDREDLLRRVLQAWSDRSTALLTARLESARDDPLEQLRDVISLPFRGRAAQRAARIELAIRAWARRDPMAQAALDASDASRLDYHASIFKALGFDADEAGARAFLTYSYEISESLLSRQGSPGDRAARREFIERVARGRVR